MADNYTFFTPQRLDYGDEYLYKGRAELGSGIAGGLRSIASANQSTKDYKMKMDLQKQMKLDDEDRQRKQSIMDDWSSAFPGQQPPQGADGNPDLTGMMGKLGYFKRIGSVLEKEGALAGVPRGNVETAAPTALPNFDAKVAPDAPLGGTMNPNAIPATSRPQNDTEFMQSIQQKNSAQKQQERAAITADAVAVRRADTEAAAKDGRVTSFRAVTGFDPTPEYMTKDGDINAAGLKKIGDSKKTGQLTQTQRNSEYAVDQGIKSGAISPEQRDEAIAAFSQQLMGRAPQFPGSERDTAVGNAKYLQSLDALRAGVDAIPKGGFGPIENRLALAKNKIFGGAQDYATVDQLYKEAGATKAFGEGGKQLTNTEKEMTFGQIGDPNSESFPEQLATHYDRARNVVQLQLERLKSSPHRFTSEGRAAIAQLEKSLAGKTGGAESIAHKKDDVDALVEKYLGKK